MMQKGKIFSMMQENPLRVVMLFVGIFLLSSVIAQEPSGSWRNLDCVRESEPWLSGNNASGLTWLSDSIQRIAIAEVYAVKSDGKFINYYQSDNSFAFGALTESFYRLNNKTVFYGKIDYLNFTGKNMGGSVLINPDYNAFNIVEVNNANKGQKVLERYHLLGATGVQLSPRFALGAKIDYLTSNYAKQKDLRHKNGLLDLMLTIGAEIQLSKTVDLGVNYIYCRNIEGIEFDRFGDMDRIYNTLIDFGVFYGRTELYGQTVYTKDRTPFISQCHGAAIQVNLKITNSLRFFNDFSFLLRDGYFGFRTWNKVVFTEHDGMTMAYSGIVSYIVNQDQHFLKINFRNEQLANYENIFKQDGTPVQTYYYGNSQVLDRNRITGGLEYVAQLKVQDNCPEWILKAGGNYSGRQQTTSLYPFYREQDIHWWDAYLYGSKNITSRKNQYGVSLRLLYGAGGGDMNKDGTYVKPSEDTRAPFSLDSYLKCEYEYLTASRVTGNIGFTYSRMFSLNLRGYIRAEYELTKAFQIEYLDGNQFNSFRLSVGCNF